MQSIRAKRNQKVTAILIMDVAQQQPQQLMRKCDDRPTSSHHIQLLLPTNSDTQGSPLPPKVMMQLPPSFLPLPPLPPILPFLLLPFPQDPSNPVRGYGESCELPSGRAPAEIDIGVLMTSGGNNFNYFPDNQLTKFKLCPPTSLFLFPSEDFCDAFCVARGAFGRPWRHVGYILTCVIQCDVLVTGLGAFNFTAFWPQVQPEGTEGGTDPPMMPQDTFLTKNRAKFIYFSVQNPAREAYSSHNQGPGLGVPQYKFLGTSLPL